MELIYKYKYSIIIPHYNDSTRLTKLIKTVPTRDDIEIIIVDDNSDEVLDLSSLSKWNISLYTNTSGIQSAGACRNIGLENALGKWLLFADSDDFFLPSAFNVFDNYFNSAYEVIFFSPTSIDLKTGSLSDRHIHFCKLIRKFNNNESQQIKYSFSVPWSKLVLNSFVQSHSIKFDEIIASNDIIFSLKIGVAATFIKAVNTNVYCVTKGEGSLIGQLDKATLRVRFLASMRRNELLQELKVRCYQESIFTLFKKYHRVINKEDLSLLFHLITTKQLIILPSRFRKSLL